MGRVLCGGAFGSGCTTPHYVDGRTFCLETSLSSSKNPYPVFRDSEEICGEMGFTLLSVVRQGLGMLQPRSVWCPLKAP
jgi:hypothetical protein